MTKKKAGQPRSAVPPVVMEQIARAGANVLAGARRAALEEAEGAFLTVEQAARVLGITPHAVRKQCRLGQLKAKKQGRRWQISKKALEKFD